MTRPSASATRLLLLRVWRLAVLAGAAWLLPTATDRRASSDSPARLPLELAQHFFPQATRVRQPDMHGAQAVLDAAGKRIGTVLTTAPETDDLVGYAGPNNLLVALGPDGRIVGMELLGSGDTDAHVEIVRQTAAFWHGLDRWHPALEPPPPTVPVSGSTLTSLTMQEAVRRRLAGVTVSLRFPDPLTLDEVRPLFSGAAQFEAVPMRAGWHRVIDSTRNLLGYAVRTSPHSDNVRGYGGPTESVAAVGPDGRTVLAIRLRRSYDTPDYVNRVRKDTVYLGQLAGRTIEEWAAMDYQQSGLEGVSGATQTSFAVAEGLKRRFAADLRVGSSARRPWGFTRARDWALVAIVAGALLFSFSPLRGNRALRVVWQVVLVAGLGLWIGDLLSVAFFVGQAQHGPAELVAPGLLLLAVVALVVPWSTGRQVYCFHLCPHGAVQEWLAGIQRWHVKLPPACERWLALVPGALLGLAFLFALVGWRGDLAWMEPFDAWALKTGAEVSGIVALLSLMAALLVPQAYCRYGCPTGALLKFVRTTGSGDRFGRRDAAALALLTIGATLVLGPGLGDTGSTGAEATARTRVGGTAFGTAWTVTTRLPLTDPAYVRDQLQAELDRIESTLSHWNPRSATSRFNEAETTQEVLQPAELIRLLERATAISRATAGAFDVTIAPLAKALGFGPGAIPGTPPDAEAVATARVQIGWDKLRIHPGNSSLAKSHPGLQLDLGAMLQGYAADRLAFVLRDLGMGECLVDVGGELRASGTWIVAVEDPGSPGTPLRRLELKDAALSTSGIYRGSVKDPPGRRRAHILDPRLGKPVEHNTVQVAVVAPLAVEADAWATALMVLGGSEALRVADREKLAVLIVSKNAHGALVLQANPEFERMTASTGR